MPNVSGRETSEASAVLIDLVHTAAILPPTEVSNESFPRHSIWSSLELEQTMNACDIYVLHISSFFQRHALAGVETVPSLAGPHRAEGRYLFCAQIFVIHIVRRHGGGRAIQPRPFTKETPERRLPTARS